MRTFVQGKMDRDISETCVIDGILLIMLVHCCLHALMRVSESMLYAMCFKVQQEDSMDEVNEVLKKAGIRLQKDEKGNLAKTRMDGPHCWRLFEHIREVIDVASKHSDTQENLEWNERWTVLWDIWYMLILSMWALTFDEFSSALNCHNADPTVKANVKFKNLCFDFVNLWHLTVPSIEFVKSFYLHVSRESNSRCFFHSLTFGIPPR